MQHSLKLGGANYHFTWVKVSGTAPYRKALSPNANFTTFYQLPYSEKPLILF